MDDALRPGPVDLAGLVGRAPERALVRSFLDRARDDGAALVVTGEPGIGKTALLDAAARQATASGAQVLRVTGVEVEADVGFAGLHQLLLPLVGELDALPEPRREACAVALGLATGPAPDRLVVWAAALDLLRWAARRAPVLLVVDDLPWLDPPSTEVLGFVARRLAGARIGLLAAARTESDSSLLRAGLPQLDLSPLDDDAARELLLARSPALGGRVRQRVLAAAQGNPLALVELPTALAEAQRRGDEPLPPSLPLSSRLRGLLGGRIGRLPTATRRLLLLAALDGTGDLRTLRAAAPSEGWLDDLAPAERDRLVRVDTAADRLVLRHPLIGSAAVELSTSAERRRAHGVLADVLVDQPERRAWHLAEAAVGPDARAADLLDGAAHRARQRGDAVRAVDALLRAAQLSPTGADRARRLAQAAFVGADATGGLRDVPHLLGEAQRADPDTGRSLEVAVAAAHHLLNGEGDVDTAHLVLVRAIDSALGQDRDVGALEDALHSLLLVCHFGGREELWRPLERALRDLGAGAPPVLSVSSSVFADPARATSAELARLDALIAAAEADADPTRIVRTAIAAFYVDRLPGCRQALWRVVRDGRDGGAAASAVNALMMLCHDALVEGRWEDARRTAEEGVAWGAALGYRLISLPGVYCLALLAAARGDEEATRSMAEELVTWSVPRGISLVGQFAHRACGLAASGRGDFEEAYRQLTAICPPGRFAPHVPVALPVAFDLVEAAVRTGRRAEARAHVAAMAATTVFRVRPRLALLAAGSAALVASEDDVADRFTAALAVPGADRHPFDLARVQLAHGEHLRRTRATSASRVQLTAALETFQRLGAGPWVTRARHELRATGLTHPASALSGGSPALTAQEHEIALLAASGLSNKQIGSRLYLSPRTVSAHLYRVFPKLGVGSRAALRDALQRAAPPTPDPPAGDGHPMSVDSGSPTSTR